jgi:hypothetical protein
MQLTGRQIGQIRDALLSAYTKDSLAEMVRIELDARLDAVAGGDSLHAVVFNLVAWAEQNGRIDELIGGACSQNPHNELIQQSARDAAVCRAAAQETQPSPVQPAPVSSAPRIVTPIPAAAAVYTPAPTPVDLGALIPPPAAQYAVHPGPAASSSPAASGPPAKAPSPGLAAGAAAADAVRSLPPSAPAAEDELSRRYTPCWARHSLLLGR